MHTKKKNIDQAQNDHLMTKDAIDHYHSVALRDLFNLIKKQNSGTKCTVNELDRVEETILKVYDYHEGRYNPNKKPTLPALKIR